MTRHSPARFVLAVCLAGLLTACGADDTALDETGDTAAAQEPVGSEDIDSGDDSGSSEGDDGGDDGGGDDGGGDDAAGRPGGPEPEEPDGARPGGPFDVEAFEQIGQPAEEFLPFGYDYCSEGRCTLVEETVEDPDVSYCGVDSFSYDPPARPEDAPPSEQFIQRGTTVTVLITCPPEDGTEEGAEEGVEESPDEESTDEESTGEESTGEETTEEETTEPQTTEEEPAA